MRQFGNIAIWTTIFDGFIDKFDFLIQIKHLLKMLVPSEVYHQKMKIEMTEYIRAKYPGDNS